VTIPVDFYFCSTKVNIRCDPESGDVILWEVPSLTEVFAALDATNLPANSMSDADRNYRPHENHRFSINSLTRRPR
jgi:hypothetical protein